MPTSRTQLGLVRVAASSELNLTYGYQDDYGNRLQRQ